MTGPLVSFITLVIYRVRYMQESGKYANGDAIQI